MAATDHSNEGAAQGAPAREDRFWILVNASGRESYLEQLFCGGPRPTLVVRDREHLLVSVDVGRGSALAVPFKIDELACSGATLIVRLASATAPCGRCVDESLASAASGRGGLDADAVLTAVRAGIARCAARALAEPTHVEPDAAGRVDPDAAGRAVDGPGPRSTRALRLVPPNAPDVVAGGTPALDKDVDVILII